MASETQSPEGGVNENPAPLRLDLFGDPVPDGWGKRGRPAHIATLENRNKVILLLALGWNNARIANALYITVPTLKKSYKDVLKVRDEMRDRMNAAIAERLWKLLQEGSVAGIREFRDFVRSNDLMVYGQTEKPLSGDKPEKVSRLGKKEQAQEDAQRPDPGTPLGELMAQRQGQPVN